MKVAIKASDKSFTSKNHFQYFQLDRKLKLRLVHLKSTNRIRLTKRIGLSSQLRPNPLSYAFVAYFTYEMQYLTIYIYKL